MARAQSIVDYYANLLTKGLEGLDSFVCFFEVVVSGPQTVIVLCAEFNEDKIDRAQRSWKSANRLCATLCTGWLSTGGGGGDPRIRIQPVSIIAVSNQQLLCLRCRYC